MVHTLYGVSCNPCIGIDGWFELLDYNKLSVRFDVSLYVQKYFYILITFGLKIIFHTLNKIAECDL